MTHACLMHTGIYNEFARMPFPFDPFDSNIEVLHNAIHNAAGGEGSQLTTTKFAAFDPLFWLHHANLDRVFAFWQVLNPAATIVDERERSGEIAGWDKGKPLMDWHWDEKDAKLLSQDSSHFGARTVVCGHPVRRGTGKHWGIRIRGCPKGMTKRRIGSGCYATCWKRGIGQSLSMRKC